MGSLLVRVPNGHLLMSTRDRLINWGRAFRDTRGHLGHCRSIEYRYVPGEAEKALLFAEAAQEERASRPPAPDMRDAILVNNAWKLCAPLSKRLLKWSFCMGRVEDDFVCRRCRIRIEALPVKFYHALKEIERILDETETVCANLARRLPSTSADKRLPPSGETIAPRAVRATVKETEEVD